LLTALEVIAQYLNQAIAAERSFESQFRSCAKDGDDLEVQTFFAASAERASLNAHALGARLSALNATEHGSSRILDDLLAMAPKLSQTGHIAEERIAQNLMQGFALSKSACAMYLALESAARAAGDEQTAELARRLGSEAEVAAGQFWHFLPSRSKIAYNVCTAGEIDPAVETRAPDDRLTETLP
jgi:hypothetical protein